MSLRALAIISSLSKDRLLKRHVAVNEHRLNTVCRNFSCCALSIVNGTTAWKHNITRVSRFNRWRQRHKFSAGKINVLTSCVVAAAKLAPTDSFEPVQRSDMLWSLWCFKWTLARLPTNRDYSDTPSAKQCRIVLPFERISMYVCMSV